MALDYEYKLILQDRKSWYFQVNMLNWLLWACVRLSDLCGIYCIVLLGNFQPSGTPGKFK